MATPSPATASAVSASEVKHLADRLHAAQVKVKKLARLELAIVDVFMEVLDRTATLPTAHGSKPLSEDDSAFARAKRKDEYVKKAEGDPIALLNALRTHLRVQFTSHESLHHDLQYTIEKLTVRSERNTDDATDEIRKWEAACEKKQQQLHALAEQLTTAQGDHDRVTRQYTHTLEQLNANLQTLRATSETQRDQLTKRQADMDELKRANELLARDRKRITDELARTGDHLRSSSGGSPLATHGGASSSTGGVTGLFGSTPAEQQNLKRVLQDYECQASKLASANDELRRELQRQQHQLVSVKQSTQAQHCVKLEKDGKKVREVLADKTKQMAEQEAELLRTRGHLKEREALIRDMKDEYNKLFTAMQKIKQHAPTQARPLMRASSSSQIGLGQSRSPTRTTKKPQGDHGASAGSATADQVRAQANENPYLLGHYKAQIEQQDKVIERLQTQLRKMIASEYRHKQKNKQFRVERVALKDTCDHLRGDLERAVKTTAKAMAQHMPFAVDDGDDDDFKRSRSTSVQPEDENSDDEASRQASNQLCCTIADVRRLKERNQFLEARFRLKASETEVVSPPKGSTRPPRPASTSSINGMRASSSAAVMPTLPLSTERSINATTMQALQQVKHSARARPQSAGPRALLHSKSSSVITKSLL